MPRLRPVLRLTSLVVVILFAGSIFAGCGKTNEESQRQPVEPSHNSSATAMIRPASPSTSSAAAQAVLATPGVPLISRSAAGIRIDLDAVELEGRFILARFQVLPADPATHSDLGQFGVLMTGGVFPSIDMQLGGLAWPQQYFPIVNPVGPVPNPGYPATPSALKFRTARAYDVTIPFKLLAVPSEPVTINVVRLLFNNPSRNVVNGPWNFSFVPAKAGKPVAAPRIARDDTAARIQPALDALQRAGLVFSIDKTVDYEGRQITLLKAAFDRDITYLTYRTGDGQPIDPSILGGHNGNMAFLQLDMAASPILPPLPVAASPSTVYWLALSGLPAETRTLYLEFMPGPTGGPAPGLDTPVPNLDGGGIGPRLPRLDPLPVDLSSLAKLPQPQAFSGPGSQVTGKGMQFQAFQLKRGYAVSTIEISASVTNPNLLVPAGRPATPREALTLVPKAEVDGQPVAVVANSVQAQHGVATDDLRLMNLPDHGTLTVTIDRQDVAFDAGKKVDFAKGPWTLTVKLEPVK